MDRQMETIIKRQQEYQRMKRLPLSVILDRQSCNGISDGYLVEAVIPEIKKTYNRRRRERNSGKCAFILTMIVASSLVLLMAVMLACIFFYLQTDILGGDKEIDKTYEDFPAQKAEQAIASGDYSEAERILDAELASNPDAVFFYIVYADLYMAQGRNDEAAEILIDIIYSRFHVQNVFSAENKLYQKLKEIPLGSLGASEAAYQRCLADCEEYIGKYQEMCGLMEQGSYYLALAICDELKAEGAYDSYLLEAYCQCYYGLKAYDMCAEYLIGLYGKQQGITDLRYPSDETINAYLQEVKGKVSDEMEAKIESYKTFTKP